MIVRCTKLWEPLTWNYILFDDGKYCHIIIKTLPLLGAADSETGMVITPWRLLGGGEIHSQEEGVKSILRRTTCHMTSLPGFWFDGNKYILVQFLVYQISSLQVVDNVINNTRRTDNCTTVVNYYSWLHHSINYDRLSSSLIIPPIS